MGSSAADARYHIAIDGQALAGDRPTGLGRVARSVAAELKQLSDVRVDAIMPPDPAGFARARERWVWEQWQLPCKVSDRGAPLLYSPAFGCPFLGGFKKLLMVHDLLPVEQGWETHSGRLGGAQWYWRKYLPESAASASAVVVNSRETREALLRCTPVSRNRVYVLPLGAPWEAGSLAREAAVESWRTVCPFEEPYALMVGSLVPRKDGATALRAIQVLNHQAMRVPLVVVGSGDAYGEQLRQLANDLGIAEQVHWCDYVADDEQLRAIYDGAGVVICPSQAEGFDLPAVEGACAGVAVVASELPVHHEVMGTAAQYFPVGDPSALAQLISDLWRDERARDEWALRALARGRRYSWERHAAGVAALARLLIDGEQLPSPDAFAATLERQPIGIVA
ncbi:MAG: glycosyltransferase family 1 protein [bacterium]